MCSDSQGNCGGWERRTCRTWFLLCGVAWDPSRSYPMVFSIAHSSWTLYEFWCLIIGLFVLESIFLGEIFPQLQGPACWMFGWSQCQHGRGGPWSHFFRTLQAECFERLRCFFYKWCGCQPKNRGGPPKWMVKMMENPMNKWMIWGYHYFWKHPCISKIYTP